QKLPVPREIAIEEQNLKIMRLSE
ncbi:hypothetical protein E3A20_19610, partial [Planctomyces bekefii]